MIPYAMAMMVVAPLSARFVERLGTKRVVTAGLLDRSPLRSSALSFIHADHAVPASDHPASCLMAVGHGHGDGPRHRVA